MKKIKLIIIHQRVILTCLLMFVTLIANSQMKSTNTVQTNNSITILYNNIAGDNPHELNVAGGFSALIEFNGKKLLFDTGGNYSILKENTEKLGITEPDLDGLFLSHNHWDHVYGIPVGAMALKNGAKIYATDPTDESISTQFPRGSIQKVTEAKEIFPGYWTSGEMDANLRGTHFTEHALYLLKEKNIYIIVGCSHPGIVEIAGKAKDLFPDYNIELITGGFHLRSHSEKELEKVMTELKDLGVHKMAPSHCTGDMAIKMFKKEWGDNFVQMYLGDVYEF